MEIKRTFDILPYALKNHPFDDCLAAKVNDDWKVYSTQEFSDKVKRNNMQVIFLPILFKF